MADEIFDAVGWNTFTPQEWYGFTAEQWYGFHVSLFVEAFHIFAPKAEHTLYQDSHQHVSDEPIATAVWSAETNSLIFVPQSLMTMFVTLENGLLWCPKAPTEIFAEIEKHTFQKSAPTTISQGEP